MLVRKLAASHGEETFEIFICPVPQVTDACVDRRTIEKYFLSTF
jgi:hypothetical protein